MSALVEHSLDFLRSAGVVIERGMSEAELIATEAQFQFQFGSDHREFLSRGLPVGDRWCDWRHDPEAELRKWVDWPIKGVLFDVEKNWFWAASWGARPESTVEAVDQARAELSTWPQLVPIRANHYLPGAPSEPGAPIFSVWQTDVVFFGANLLDYVRHLLGPRDDSYYDRLDISPTIVPPWSLIASDVAEPVGGPPFDLTKDDRTTGATDT